MSSSTVLSRMDVAAGLAGSSQKSSRRPVARCRSCGRLPHARAKIPVAAAEAAMQTAQVETIRFVRRGSRARRKAFDVQLRKDPRDIGEKPWPFGRGRRAEKLDY